MWQRLQALVAQKRQLVTAWTESNHAYFQALELAALEPLPPLLPTAPPDGRLAAANRERELSLDAILASDLANLSQDLLDRYVVHCQAVLARDREWAVGLFITFMLTASGLSLYAIYLIRRADGAIQAADARYRNLFLNAVEGIFQTSPEGQFLDVNPALASILKFDSPQELIKTYDNLENQLYIEPGRREILRSLLAQNSVVNHFESQVFCKDGAIIWISESVRAVFDSEGQLLHYEGTLADVTARKQAEETLQVERERTDRLLLNILPHAIVSKLKAHLAIIAESYTEATILFADIVDFTGLASQIDPAELVKLLNEVFTMFDAIADSLALEKIKTIGDAYMVVGGVPEPRTDHALAVVEMAIAMQAQIARIQRPDGQPFALRIGINTGSVVAGVIGTKKFIYDLWGDAVNVASRMESLGVAGEIQITETTAKHIHTDFKLEPRGMLDVKGKGQMPTYWVGERYRPQEHSASSENPVPLLETPVDYCGVQRPGFPIAIGLYHNQKPYYRLESLALSQALALQYAQLKLTRHEYPEDNYLLLAYEGGYHLYHHHGAFETL
ncbi:MAG: PAS domain S-box protein [Synechococcaceae cyanobacterium SM2_3_60]|nr:PAS domain S-box protein [Synechococcaceae cyanobacterium SM2_3_60]